MTNAAAAADIVIVTLPYATQEGTLAEIAPQVAGKIGLCRSCRPR